MNLFSKYKPRLNHIFILVLLVSYAFILMRPIDLTVQDIGRHLMNGKEVLAGNWQVLYRNHYSYTAADYRFVNHHWLFGLINYLVYLISGFKGIHLLHIFTLLTGLGLLIDLMKKNGHAFFGLVASLWAVLFLSARLEIRPEALGWLFFIHTLWQLKQIQIKNKITQKQILLLLLQQLIWVNWHISFIFGISLPVLLWFFSNVLQSPNLNKEVNSRILKLCLGLAAISLLNPNFTAGLLQPLTIFSDYGYSVVENQSLLFLWRVVGKPNLFGLIAFGTIAAWLFLYQRRQLNLFEIMQLFLGLVLGMAALRHTPLFVGLSLPIFAKLCYVSWNKFKQKYQIKISPVSKPVFLGLLYGSFLLLLISGRMIMNIRINNRFIGLPLSQLQSANYIKSRQFDQPIFNNYDLGSYLIFHFYPEMKVFVDNRPEAYGKYFFQKEYIPMQLSQEIWQKQMEKHNFKTIIFGKRDMTYWAQTFLEFIEAETDWEEDYVDDKVIIYYYTGQMESGPNL